MTGQSRSPDFPLANPFQPDWSGHSDAFVAKLNSTGSSLVYSTYLGGQQYDFGSAIAVDSPGSAYVTGFTRSADFPTANPLDSELSGTGNAGDAFVTKLTPAGSGLVYSTYLGGEGEDIGYGIAVDQEGNAFITGRTSSVDFPTANAFQPTHRGGMRYMLDAFVTKIDATGFGLVYSTYLGGPAGDGADGSDIGSAIAVDPEGNAYVTGKTSSPDFPTSNALQSALRDIVALKSTDGGNSWSPIHTGLVNGYLHTLVVDPGTPSTLYAGTGTGVFKSTDGGSNWGRISPSNLHARAITIDPTNPSTLYAGTWKGGVFKSTNGGARWSPVNSGLRSRLRTLVVDPRTPSTLYAGTTNGVSKSTDGGNSWNATALMSFIFDLVIDSTTPSTLYAGTERGVSKSTDGGSNWTSSSLSNIHALAIDPTDSSTLYAGTDRGVFKSTDAGDSWQATALMNFIFALVIDSTTPSTLYAGTTGGVFKSADRGNSWTPTPLTASIEALAIDPVTSSTLYAASQGSSDTFVAKFSAAGSLVYSTYLGGGGTDDARGISVDQEGNAYVTGETQSGDFPTVNPSQPALRGVRDAYVAKLGATGSSLVYSTYLGGNGIDRGDDIAVDLEGNAYVTGATSSPDFPTVNSLQGASGLRRMLNRPVAGVGLVPIYRHAFVAKIHRTWLSMAKPKGPSPRQQKLGQAAELGSIASGSKLIGKPAPKLAAKLNKAVGSQELAKVDHLLKQSKALEQSLAIYKSLQGYRDTTTTERHLVSPSMDSRITTQMFFAFERPDRLRLETKDGPAGEWVMVSNGKDLVTYRGMWKQYTTEKTPREWQSAERRWMFSSGLDHLVQRLVLSKNPARELLEEVEEVVEKGRDDLEGTPAIIVELKMPAKSLGERWAAHKMIPVRLWIDERDFLIRKGSYDLDWETMSQKMPEEMRRRMPFKQMTLIMEFTDIELNPVFPEDTFRFSPPEDATLVEHFGPPDGRSPVSQGELVGRRAPNFVLKDIQGKKVGLDDFKGKVLIVDFWATWCSPCREQMPTYTALQSLYAPRGFSMIGLSVDDGPEVVRDFAENYRVNFPLLMADEQVRQQYGGTGVLPTTFVIDKGGIVRYEFKGPPPAKLLFQRRVEELLEERITIDREDATPRPEAGDASSVPENITSPGQPAVSHNQQASKTEIARFIQFRLVANAPSNQADEMTLIDDALRAHRVWLEKKVQLDLNDVKHAEVESRYEQPYSVRVVLTSEATKKFSQITGNNIGRSVAVVIDGELVMAPSITGQLNFKKVPIRFGLTLEEAQALAAKVNELVAGRSH